MISICVLGLNMIGNVLKRNTLGSNVEAHTDCICINAICFGSLYIPRIMYVVQIGVANVFACALLSS